MNPASIMKIMNAKNRFTENHPRFVAFLNAVFSKGIEEGTVIELRVTGPGQETIDDKHQSTAVRPGASEGAEGTDEMMKEL